ncbi:C40 family peptidase [Bizionia sediminis]|uniref:C40 family peptidase n=1 Tax=Bizionia sediminis TaxID=1737064 RepID=A0ABW5KUP3_9FLAO
MQKIVLILICFICFSACKSSKNTAYRSKKSPTSTKAIGATNATYNPTAESVINYAKTFNGVKYKYGGSSKKGMDCSGLIVTSFKKEGVLLPRTTSELAVTGNWVDVKAVKKGDLLFFATKKNSRKVNHVGIVTQSRPGFVEFIHASTSKGVMLSELSERYWYFAFVQARRIL